MHKLRLWLVKINMAEEHKVNYEDEKDIGNSKISHFIENL